jgi:hypothetical protein
MKVTIGVTVEQLPALGRSYNEDDDIFVLDGDLTADETERLQRLLSRAVKVR